MKFLDIDFLLIQYGWQLVEPFDGGGEFQF